MRDDEDDLVLTSACLKESKSNPTQHAREVTQEELEDCTQWGCSLQRDPG